MKAPVKAELDALEQELDAGRAAYVRDCAARGLTPFAPVSMDKWLASDLKAKLDGKQAAPAAPVEPAIAPGRPSAATAGPQEAPWALVAVAVLLLLVSLPRPSSWVLLY